MTNGFLRCTLVLSLTLGIEAVVSAQSGDWNTTISSARGAYVQKDYDKSERLYREALLQAETMDAGSDTVLESLSGLIVVLNAKKQYAESEKIYIRAIGISQELYGAKSPKAAQMMARLADHYVTVGELLQSEAWYRQAIDIQAENPNVPPVEYVATANQLARCLGLMKRYRESEVLLKQAAAVQEKIVPVPSSLATTYTYLAGNYLSRGMYGEAERIYLRCLELQLASGDAKTAAFGIGNLALLYRKQGRYDLSVQLYQKAIEAIEKQYDTNSEYLLGVLQQYGTLLRSLQRYDEAARVTERIDAIKSKSPN